jgi:hypothetical protein
MADAQPGKSVMRTFMQNEEIIMLNRENRKDKDRFEKLKDAQVDRGRDEKKATKVAASEVKEMRRREGRSKQQPA